MDDRQRALTGLKQIFGRNRYVIRENHLDHCYTDVEVLDVENPCSPNFIIKLRAKHIGFIKIEDGVTLPTFLKFLTPDNYARVVNHINDENSNIYKCLIPGQKPSLFYTFVLYPILWFLTITMLSYPKTEITLKPGNYMTGVETETYFTLSKQDVLKLNFKNSIDGIYNVFDD